MQQNLNSHDGLVRKLRIATLQLKYHIAASRVMHFAFKAGFHADQPRVPRGNPDGGQWILIGKRPWPMHPRSPVDLVEEERKGGHAILKHVGKSEAYLSSRLGEFKGDDAVFTYFSDRASSYHDLASANRFTNAVIDAHPDAVDYVRSGKGKSVILYQYFDEVTGYQVRTNKRYYETGEIMTYELVKTDGAAVVIFRDNRSRNGFRVETSYPITQDGTGND